MGLGDITEVGFYKEVDGEGKEFREEEPTYKERYEDLLREFEDWKQAHSSTKVTEENDELRQRLREVIAYCEDQNLKYDTTACEVLGIIGGHSL